MKTLILLIALAIPQLIFSQDRMQYSIQQGELPVVKGPASVSIAPSKVASQEWKFFDGNTIQCTINSAGPYCDYLRTNSSGLFWPKGSNKTAVYTAGIWITGIHRPTGLLRTAVQDYVTEFQPGPVLSTFNTTTNSADAAANPNDPKYHIYKINKGDEDLPPTGRNLDYDYWPGDLGAPFIDVNGNGRWDGGIDKPKLYGDQELWCVYNDANQTNHLSVGTTAPMGIEAQATYFGFANVFPNIMFVRWKIINKSDADYDSVFVSLWSDTDLGDGNDDMAACDTTLNLVYVYNGDNNDGTPAGYGNKPPSDGFVLLQGPKVPGQPTDSAISEGLYTHGYKNLRAYSSSQYFNTQFGAYTDPPLGNAGFPRFAHENQNGISGGTHTPYTDPTTGLPCKFVFPGDPVTESGWTMQKAGVPPQDGRGMISVGPFTLAKQDTQEIVGAFAIAQGSDRLNSVVLLRQYVDLARKSFLKNFTTVPIINATVDTHPANPVISIVCDPKNSLAQSVDLTLRKSDGTSLAQLTLLDDGLHGDGAAGDKVFGNSISTLPPQDQGVVVDVSVTTSGSSPEVWPAFTNITTTRVQQTTPVILSDNLNDDGKVNPAENVQFNVTLTNPYPFGFSNLTLDARTPFFSNKSIRIPSLPANSQFTPSYNPTDTNSFLDFTIPQNFTGDKVTILLAMSDTTGNRWLDSVSFPVYPLIRENAVLQRLRGHSSMSPAVIITNKPATENKTYVISGIDSADANSTPGYSVKDSASGSILVQHEPLTEPEFLGHVSPPINGFRINWEGTYTNALSPLVPTYSISNPVEFPWFTPGSATIGKLFSPGSAGSCVSSLRSGDFRDVQVRFSSISGFTDVNGNGVYDLGEPYKFDTLNTEHTQRAYFYRQENVLADFHYAGYFMVPLAAYDVTSNPPRQLSLLVVDRDKNNQWDADLDGSITYSNFIYILSDSYDPTGRTYDTTKGGVDLGSALHHHSPIPSYWALWVRVDGAHTPYAGEGDCYLNVLIPLTSLDSWTFNPTTTTGVPASQVPARFALQQSYPNPFNPSATISYSLEKPVLVRLVVYNLLGQRVKALIETHEQAGNHVVVWDGTDYSGRRVASGVYFYRLEAGSFTATKKMVMVK